MSIVEMLVPRSKEHKSYREIVNYAKPYKSEPADTDHLDISDGGHYNFMEHRNLSDLGGFIVDYYKNEIKEFIARSV